MYIPILSILINAFFLALHVSCECPSPKVQPIENASLELFLEHPWYVQQQMSVIYQRPKELFCVRDTYYLDPKDNNAVYLKTDWNNDKVGGPKKTATMHGVMKTSGDPSFLLVGPKLVPTVFRGPYWIISAGSNDGNDKSWDWMIVSGGPPRKEGKSGRCRTGHFLNYSGLWLFTKKQVADEGTVMKMRQILEDLGYDLSVLIKVPQEGCQY